MPANRYVSGGHVILRRGRVSLPHQIYLVTTTTHGRSKFFVNFTAARVAASCFENKTLLGDATMLAWVLMPDHVHWLLQLGEHDKLSIIVNRLKSASSRQANQALGRAGRIWSPAYHDHALRAEEDLQATARYIVANPVRAGLVQHVGDYPFWDAIWV